MERIDLGKPRVLVCAGTRPEIIKLAPVVHALSRSALEPILVHSGQHSGRVEEIYNFFAITPDVRIELPRRGSDLAHLTALLLERLAHAIAEARPSAVLVQGDTTTAMTGALAGFYAQVPVGHVEAGLRTFETYDPFPEEVNRTLIARLARWHFTPTPQATRNLEREGIAADGIAEVGNTVVDAVRFGLSQLDDSPSIGDAARYELRRQGLADLGGRYCLVTAHRRENWGSRMTEICRAVRMLLLQDTELHVVWPLHPNPAIQTIVRAEADLAPPEVRARIHLTEPLDYPLLLWALRGAWLVLTDSGGIQEEAAETRTPVLVLRETSERLELVRGGGAILVGVSPGTIVDHARRLAANPRQHEAMRLEVNPFGDGRASERIVETLVQSLLGVVAMRSRPRRTLEVSS